MTDQKSAFSWTLDQGVAVVTLENPPVNALRADLLESFERFLLDVLKSDARAVLLRSACPGFFSAGDDLSALVPLPDDLPKQLRRAHRVLDSFEALPLPTVAALNGHALGGGLELAMVADFRIMAKGAGRVGLPEARLGMIPALGGTQRLAELVGKGRAIEMMFKGLQLSAEEAVDIGLVHRAVDEAELDAAALDFAVRLARQATEALAHIKRAVRVGQREGFSAGIAAEQAAFAENIVSHDAREGVRAFLAGEKPNFTGNRTEKH